MGRFSFGLDLRKLYISIVKLFDAPRFTREKLMVMIKSTITPLDQHNPVELLSLQRERQPMKTNTQYIPIRNGLCAEKSCN